MAEAQSGCSRDGGLDKPGGDQLLKEMQTPVMHAAKCQDSRCDVTDCKKIKKLFNHSSICEVHCFGGCKICQGLWLLISFHANSCSSSNCPVPTCKEWRENLKRIPKESESESGNTNSEDVEKLLLKLAIDLQADPSAGQQQAGQLVEPNLSKGKGALVTGSASGPGSSSLSVTGSGSTASQQKMKQQVDSASNKSKVTAKLLQELVAGSLSCSCSDQASGSGKSARQRRMKRRVAEGSRKNRSQIQTNSNMLWDEYTDQDKKIILGATYLIFFALLLKNQIYHI